MSQVPVKWVYETFDEKPPAIPANGSHVVSAPLDHDILPHAVVPLSALREVVEGLKGAKSWLEQLANRFDFEWPNTANQCRIHARSIERLLASLGEQ